jgi:hypothetical protein
VGTAAPGCPVEQSSTAPFINAAKLRLLGGPAIWKQPANSARISQVLYK